MKMMTTKKYLLCILEILIYYIIFALLLLLCGCTSVKTVTVKEYVYPSLPLIEQPNVLSLNACKFSLSNDENIFVGFDKDNYKCYLKNQEINREQKKLYQKIIDEINAERIKWKEMNKEG